MSRLGSPNKNKKFLLARLQDMYGEQFHPIMKMAEAASKLDYIAEQEGDVAALTAALNGWGKIAEYTEPKLKAVEVRAVDSDAADLLLEEAVIAEIVEDQEEPEDE
jgi:hypothetical protein